MTGRSEVSRQQLIEAITAYLARSPAAADTAQGIADWWMSAMGLAVSAEDVEAALDALVQHGVIARKGMPGGGVVYRAATRRH